MQLMVAMIDFFPLMYEVVLLQVHYKMSKIEINNIYKIFGKKPESVMQMIKDITAKAELNKIYSGKVMKIMEFGAFVNFLGKQDGLVHISELADKRVAKVTDVLKEGDEVKVKVIGFDRGKVKLSIKAAV